MKAIFLTASVCAVASLVGVLGFSVMDIVPSPRAEAWRGRMMLSAVVLLLGWLGLAVWARRQTRRSAESGGPPAWVSRSVMVAGAIYVLVVLLFTVG